MLGGGPGQVWLDLDGDGEARTGPVLLYLHLAAEGRAAPGTRVAFHWWVLIALLVLATLGEIIEFAAGAFGATSAGGSKRGAVLALLGSIGGGVLGVLVGVPIPVIGQIMAALLFACVGAMAGAMLGEHWKGRTLEEGVQVGQAAFFGRLFGTLGKLMCGAVMLVVVVVAVAV